ncbi:hypothetical protein QVD17_21773 [Tagetes erecta]|uniref:Uncharacterized protein n=1 Tax=Tagetes erecta TaxID=13708 RepID=A0AAD8KCS0_TARER|nr:hypothetical protein QVD17_21773 [Tagetes erecta]
MSDPRKKQQLLQKRFVRSEKETFVVVADLREQGYVTTFRWESTVQATACRWEWTAKVFKNWGRMNEKLNTKFNKRPVKINTT